MTRSLIESSQTHVLPLEFERAYPVVVRGDGVWIEDAAGTRYLDAMSGGSMAATLGHGRSDLVAAARAQAEKLAYVHNERLTNPAQEQLAQELVDVAPEGFSRVKFVTSGSDANETSIQLARSYHVERGEPKRWQVISFAQAYHGPTMETLALTGRPGCTGRSGRTCPTTSTSPRAPRVRIRPASRRSRRWTAPWSRRAPTPSRRSSARRSAPRRCPHPRRPSASGRAWPNAATATASSSASTRWSRASGEPADGSPGRGRRARRTSSRPRRVSVPATRRSARCCAASRCSRPSRTGRAGSRSATRGTARRCRARWGSRCWTLSVPSSSSRTSRSVDGGSGTSSRPRWPTSRSCRRSGVTATCSGCRTPIRATGRSCPASSGSRAGSTRPRSSAS